MAETTARIRRYRPQDEKLVRFSIGRAVMEGLALANTKTYIHPVTFGIWIALSCMLIEYLNWWPNPALPWWTYLRPLPSFAAFSAPIMFAADWFNRPAFEERTQQTLRGPDLIDMEAYYSRSPASGLWLLEFGNKFVGLIAIDASPDSQSNETLDSLKNDKKAQQRTTKKGTSSVATIRHFYVMEEYRSTYVQDDLLQHAVKQAFQSDKTVKMIRGVECTLDKWATKAYRKAGFMVEQVIAKLGILRWSVRTRVLKRSQWEESLKKSE